MNTAKLMALMPKVMGALSSGNFKSVLPDLLTLVDDAQVNGIRDGLLKFAQSKCVDGARFSVVFEPNDDVSNMHMRVWRRLPGADAECMLDVPFDEVTAADIHSLLKPLFEQA